MASEQSTVFQGNPTQVSFLGAARDVVPATRSDTDNEALGISRGIYLDSIGAVKVTTANGEDRTLLALAVGVIHPIGCARVWDTGTTVDPGNVHLVY